MALNFEDNLRILARQAVLEEITFRVTKLWWIYSWASSVLLAITGGVIALRTGTRPLEPLYQALIAASAVVVGVYAILWLRQNLKFEELARSALAAHDDALGINRYNASIDGSLFRPDLGILVGYKLTVVFLTVAAVAASLIPLR
jgi:hypothetical protein